MELRKFAACTVCLTTVLAAAGCADGTGQALTPTLPTVDTNTTNADGTKLKASAPQPLSPRSAVRVSNLTPQLVLENGAATFAPSTGLSYIFEVFEVEGNVLVAKSNPIPAGTPQTAWDVPANSLQLNKTYAWRAYASVSNTDGSMSDVVSFRTPLPQPSVNSEPGAGGSPVPCAGSGGPSIIACVGAAYPSKLAKVSLQARKDNMEFIRDRIIETGICKGMDLARNFKRGTPVLSHDFLVWRQPGQHDRGIDIASGYDDNSRPLKLTWQVKGAPDYGYPYYAKYPPVDCSGVNP